MEILLIGETPAKKNCRINTRSGRSFPSKRYQEWHENALLQLRSKKYTLGIKEPIKRCEIELLFTHGDLRKRDSDNGTSSILDTLVDAGIIEDDNWQVVNKLTIKNQYKRNVPTCLINIIILDNITE